VRAPPLFDALLVAGLAAAPAVAQDEALPAYYEWFMREGTQAVLPPEAARDARIEQGALAPETIEGPVPDLSLPDARGAPVSLRGIARSKRLVVVVFRTWW